HVVDGADKFTVAFQDGSEVAGNPVTLRGKDTVDDLAVLKVTTKSALDPDRYQARLGDSDKLRVGQWAVAIGSPFGLQSSFTVGVVSALGRTQNIGATHYNNFIQTDAAINPGNSGGALVNVHGEVIGINTAIATGGTRSSAGVGFAIPINKAKQIMDQLITRGRVVRGYVGVTLGDLDDAMKQKTGAQSGVLVQDVMPDTPASHAGLQPEDVITQYQGKSVHNASQLQDLVRATAPGSKVQLGVVRAGKTQNLTLILGEMPAAQATADNGGESQRPGERLGIRVQAITPQVAESLRLPAGVKGVVVAQVAPGSPAEDAGLMRGDIIQKVNDQPVTDMVSFQRQLSSMKKDALVFLRVASMGPDGRLIGRTIGLNPSNNYPRLKGRLAHEKRLAAPSGAREPLAF
ncbi:MAG TPA: PDZ domain-containing protein, partial [Armatimonadota bacterium]|nr:PDZ domain-containing protein [Armatimonadota bacterium]